MSWEKQIGEWVEVLKHLRINTTPGLRSVQIKIITEVFFFYGGCSVQGRKVKLMTELWAFKMLGRYFTKLQPTLLFQVFLTEHLTEYTFAN